MYRWNFADSSGTTRSNARVVEQTPQALSGLFVVSEALEGMAVRQATIRCTGEDLEALHETIVRFEAQLDSLVDDEPYMDGSRIGTSIF